MSTGRATPAHQHPHSSHEAFLVVNNDIIFFFFSSFKSCFPSLVFTLACSRRREKLQAHLKESRSLKNYAANAYNGTADGRTKASNINLQMHEVPATAPPCLQPLHPSVSALTLCGRSAPFSDGRGITIKCNESVTDDVLYFFSPFAIRRSHVSFPHHIQSVLSSSFHL